MPDSILYNHGEVDALANSVGGSAQVLSSIHDEIKNQTDVIAAFFSGEAHTGFHESQTLMLSGFQDLIQVMLQHGHTIGDANMTAHSTDMQMKNLFT
jgi:WXG100 family type VII secretion target